MHIALVAGVEEDLVLRRVEDPVQGDGQLDHAEVGPEVSAGLGDGVDEERPDLFGELLQLLGGEPVQVTRSVDAGQQIPSVARHRLTRFARLCHRASLRLCWSSMPIR